MIKLGIIEDDNNLRSSIEAFIEFEPELKLAFSFNSVEKWIEQQAYLKESPTILLIDIGLPGLSGLNAITLLKNKYPDAKLIIITGDGSSNTIWSAIANGAHGYVSKPFSLKDLREQMQIVQLGGAALSPMVANTVLEQIRSRSGSVLAEETLQHLTKRERDVVEELIKGLTYKEIGQILKISSSTVNDHLKSIYQKLEVKSKSELIAKLLNKK